MKAAQVVVRLRPVPGDDPPLHRVEAQAQVIEVIEACLAIILFVAL